MAALHSTVLQTVPVSYVTAIAAVTDAANSSTPTAVFEVCVDVVRSLCGWPVAQIVARCPERWDRYRPTMAWRATSNAALQALAQAAAEPRDLDQDGLLARTVHSRRPAAMQRLEAMPGEPWLQAISEAGLVSAAAFPVLVGSDVVAVLELYSGEAGGLDPALTEALRVIAIQAGRAVERAAAEI